MSLKVLFIAVALVGVSLSQPTGSPEEEFSAKHVARGINKFAFDLYMEVKGEGNVFISPLSVSSALGMVYMMSNGETANELTRLMHFNNSNYDKVTSGFHSMLQSLDKNSLKAANGLFIGKDLPVKQSFKDEVKKQFNATSENLDFGGEAEKSRRHINEWVADKTEQNIKELLPKDFSSAVGEHAMVLCSAVHFKNDWIAPFNETRKGKFHSIDGTVEEVDMMFSSDTHFGYYYFRDLEVTALRIDYKDKMQSMLLLMPVGNRKFEEVEAQLVEMDIVEDILNKMYDADKTPIDVTMPKFKLESSYQLKAPLQKLGLEKIFKTNEADFSRASDAKNLEVNQVYHKAAIQVDEKGTVASAATAVDLVVRVAPIFQADRPFMFAIIDRPSSTVAFLGRYVKPAKGEN